MIYFDNSATTKVHPEVVDAMLPYLLHEYGNPSSKYYTTAVNTRRAVENAREQVAQLLGCDPDEVIFTSGSTESNNMVLKGVIDFYQDKGIGLITSKVEHPSVLETASYLKSKGIPVSFLDVDRFGRIDSKSLIELTNQTNSLFLVSLIWGNNEIGSLNDIVNLADLCSKKGVLFHTDATQVIGKIPVRLKNSRIRFLSCSAHKIHGPKGIGACVIRKDELGIKTELTPLLHGGGQENDYRSGTLSVHNIVGFGKAAELAYANLDKNIKRLKHLEEYLRHKLDELLPEIIKWNSDTSNKIPGILNLQFKGIFNELLIKKLSDHVAISTGSACSSSKPSHVLEGIGLQTDEIRSSIRISLSVYNSEDEIDQFCSLLVGK